MNLPALFSHDKMPATASHKENLMQGEPFYKWNRQEQRSLIPVEILKAIISEANENLQPATKDEILNAAQTLVGSFPGNQLKDPETFIKSLVFVMSSYPVDILRIGIMGLIKEKKWVPAVGEVNERLEKLFLQRSGIKNRAQLQLEEHERRNK